MKPLNEDTNTHLWDGSFAELAATYISPIQDRILILTGGINRSPTLRESIETTINSQLQNAEVHNDHHSKEELPYEIPFRANAFDVVIQINPTRQALYRHNPIYEAERVTTQGGTIIAKAPNYIAHSNFVDYDDIYAVNYRNGPDVSVCAVGSVTPKGCIDKYLSPNDEKLTPQSPKQPARITETGPETSNEKTQTVQTDMRKFK